MHALICNGLVYELFEVDPKFGDGFDVRDVSKVKGIAAGWSANTDGTYSAPEPVPSTPFIPDVSSAQAKIQLRRAGLRDKVDAAIKDADGEVQDWYSDARTWQRTNPYVTQIGGALGLKDADIDALFVEAAKIAA